MMSSLTFGVTTAAANILQISKRALLFSLILVGVVGCTAFASSKFEQGAAPVAEEFLKLLDEGNYQGAIEKAALRNESDSLDPLRWLKNHRAPMGSVLSRSLWGTTNRIQIPGRPDGEYLDVRYLTQFEKKTDAIEGLLLLRKNGKWTIVAYLIR
jgi:hypothetical protein